jgi:hypothetical protein
VPGDVADREEHAIAGQFQGIVPVAADLRLFARRHVGRAEPERRVRGQRTLHERFLQRIGDAFFGQVCRPQDVGFATFFGRAFAFALDARGQCRLLRAVQKRDQQDEYDRAADQDTDAIDRRADFGVDDLQALLDVLVDGANVGAKTIDALFAEIFGAEHVLRAEMAIR